MSSAVMTDLFLSGLIIEEYKVSYEMVLKPRSSLVFIPTVGIYSSIVKQDNNDV
jgi:hypothetical protein